MPLDGSAALRRWREQPQVFVRELFGIEPDPWQDDALAAFPKSPRLCLRACKGPGKTAVLAWLGWNFLLTRPHPMCGATSISGDNLKANLWTELARWREKSPVLKTTFEMTKTEIFCREHPKTWKMEARTWAKDADASQIGNALAGIHAPYVLWLGDESGDHPEAIMPTMEGIFAGAPIEAHIVQAGNP
jgi:phage terminase large subunit